MDKVKEIVSEINKGNPKPIYFLMGEEPYYIDRISKYIGDNVLSEDEKGFNQMVLYGKDTSVDEVVANAKRYPMMADYQVVIVKEAQHLSKTIENLNSYAENPQPTTILVICYKYKKLDKRKKLYKTIKKTGELFESNKLYDNQVADWVRRTMAGKNYKMSPKSCIMLVEFLGTDLSKISNELDKLTLVVPAGTEITPEIIEENIGISKDFNNFELKKAIGERNVKKAARIIDYFAQNPKDNPFVVTVTLLNTFFTQLLQYHGLSDHSPGNVAKVLGVNPYFVNEYVVAAKNYPMKRVSGIISNLRELDLKGKGVGANNMDQADLLKELLFKIA
ncbi:DNA polymerase III subunit delta [Flagellimonas zhangzhouensis]|uniref:DNA polymerase III subunit delta n=1 Tax=Flagellimonas zhangzhouensis TaxID=1073328 RepID=A0A1H2SBC7_9FLAO|nr:DNA polymerase III subunit delta [Allomuricauda zhangzhouensis]SDQ72997.1 DNA polymerase III, delta subunit [Allomuricauda zhangzhouensis]SDW28961.1 DNA polymerase III, delta subunit [Allomuricauda zhangzhouensis]